MANREGSYEWHFAQYFQDADDLNAEDAFESGWRRAESELIPVLEWTLEQLNNLTTEEYNKGGDRIIRDRLQETLVKVREQA